MKLRKRKMSKKQRCNLLHSFFLIGRELFHGKLGMEGNYHLAGVSPVAGSSQDFFFVLEKGGVSGSIGMNTHLTGGGDISAEYHIVLPSGERVGGTMEELDKWEGKTPILPVFDDLETGELLLDVMKTKEGHALSCRFEPSDEEYAAMISELERRWGVESTAEFENETARMIAIKAEHERILAEYVYEPGDGMRNLNEDEKLMISYLFITGVIEKIDNPFRFGYAMGEIFPNEERSPWAHAVFADMENKRHHIGIAVRGPLNKAGPDDIAFFCVNSENGQFIFFDSVQKALESEYSELRG